MARLADAERVLAPGARWHYSNLAFALLGRVVAEVSGVPYERYLEERILRPLRLERTTFEPVAPTATPYLVEPYEDTLRAEPLLGGVEGIGPAGQLFSTAADLCRWAAFVADPKPEVLDPKTVEEMVAVRAIADLERWTLGWGLGFELYREGERVLVGHGGAMPGFLACVAVSRKERTGAAVLTNASAGVDPELLARRLVLKTLELEPFEPGAWRPGAAPPPELAGVLGRWWSEGEEVVFRYLGGRLTAKAALAPAELPPAVFEREEADRYRTVSGREQGELLRIVRDADGATVKLYWATYPFLREPTVFS